MEVNVPAGRENEKMYVNFIFDDTSLVIKSDEWQSMISNTHYSPYFLDINGVGIKKQEEGEMLGEAKKYFDALKQYRSNVLPAKQVREAAAATWCGWLKLNGGNLIGGDGGIENRKASPRWKGSG